MLGTFWNLCRACPSVPVDKVQHRLHSEYRSTYRWHEYTGPRQDIVRRPPQHSILGPSAEPALHRRRKHPELAYRAHDFLLSFDGGTENLLEKTVVNDRARSEERWSREVSRQRSSRRSKSEGPPAVAPSYRLIHTKQNTKQQEHKQVTEESPGTAAATETSSAAHATHTGHNDNMTRVPGAEGKKGTSEYRLQFAWPPVNRVLSSRLTQSGVAVESGVVSVQPIPRKSISMSGIKTRLTAEHDTVPVHKRTIQQTTASDAEMPQPIDVATNIETNAEHNSDESKPKLSQPDGKEFKSEYKKQFQPFNKYDFIESRGVFEKRVVPMDSLFTTDSDIHSPSSSWYKEVVLLRKKANQYRHRGWGTELVPDHIAQLYNHQIQVWEQVSRRSTLSALSLATTIITKNRSTSKDDKEKETRKNSPSKSLKTVKVKSQTHREAPPGNKKSVDKSSAKVGGQSTTSSNATHMSPSQNTAKANRRPRPTSLVSMPTGFKNSLKKMEETDASCNEDTTDLATGSEDHVIKSPPEPTRVKSPEQILMRSPEPVNWTVPLDTGKTFTVTQNVREGDLLPRSYSEARVWTPTSAPPPVSISAPPQLVELAKTTNMVG